jgi:8-oxo-dGTP pyrophosphatase MutT (NUDIX family)
MSDDAGPVFQQSAVVPFRRRGEGVEVLLITSLKKKRWIVPKGLIEPDLSPQASAAQEAFEEAGVEGVVRPERLGEYTYRKWGGVCRVDVFLMEVRDVLDDWPERALRTRRWVGPEEAAGMVREPRLAEILRDLATSIA